VTTRRTFVSALAATAAICAPRLPAQPARTPHVGIVHPARVEDSAVYRILLRGLANLGYIDGQTIKLSLRSAEGNPDAVRALIDELLRQNVDALIVVGPSAVKEAVEATRNVAIIAIDLESDPVRNGWMQSLARPGGNVTGFFLDLTGTGAKWVQLLREAAPRVREIALVWDTSSGEAQLAATRAAAIGMGATVSTIAIDNWVKFEAAFGAAARARTQAFVILSSPVAFQYSSRVAQFMAQNHLPGISPFRPFAVAGGLMSYGPDLDLFFERTAYMLDKVLRGAKPAELAVEQPLKYALVVNQKTARVLGLALPRALLLRADEVIQ
jgi:putative ABC transport system substrate-binding protein